MLLLQCPWKWDCWITAWLSIDLKLDLLLCSNQFEWISSSGWFCMPSSLGKLSAILLALRMWNIRTFVDLQLQFACCLSNLLCGKKSYTPTLVNPVYLVVFRGVVAVCYSIGWQTVRGKRIEVRKEISLAIKNNVKARKPLHSLEI